MMDMKPPFFAVHHSSFIIPPWGQWPAQNLGTFCMQSRLDFLNGVLDLLLILGLS
jgi:hypothetical protein